MALKVQASFSAGELDPALHERTNLEKYKSGLKTGRNAIIGKTGRLVSRMTRKYFTNVKIDNSKVLLYLTPGGVLLEFGHQYVRFHAPGIPNYLELSHDITEAQLKNVRFEASGNYCYVFCATKNVKKLDLRPIEFFLNSSDVFKLPTAPTQVSASDSATGYAVEYVVTAVINGEESLVSAVHGGGGALQLPIAAAEENTFTYKVGTTSQLISEMRVYRRPEGKGAFGYIGSSTAFSTSGSDRRATFSDFGQAADYGHQPPSLNIRDDDAVLDLKSPVGAVYQQRLLLTSSINPEAIEASRPGFQNNFYRDYPLSSDSALSFKAGTSGQAYVLRMIDSDGLVVFTSNGVYLSAGALGPSNLSLDKKGNWVIDESLPPIAIPGGVLFVDKATNTVRSLTWSTESASYSGEELSIFSDHMFLDKRIVSWAFEESATPVLWAVFDDGSYASFTYERDQQMRAWMRHDTLNADVEYVVSRNSPGTAFGVQTYFVVNRDGKRTIEINRPRYLSATDVSAFPDLRMSDVCFPMDSAVMYGYNNVASLAAGTVGINPVVMGDWEGELRITSNAGGSFSAGDVGKIFRWFHPVERYPIDMEVLQYINDVVVIVQPDREFPSEYAANPVPSLYETYSVVDGLDHLEGQEVSVVVDGEVVASPYNTKESYPSVVVSGGQITLPNNMLGAWINVGVPIISDVETLDIDTVEQRPVLIESRIVNKVYTKVHRTRGLYVGNEFPSDNTNEGMEDLLEHEIPEEEENLVEEAPREVTRRVETTIPGDWNSNGRVCYRQVDPVHWEILSIIPDVEDQRR